MMHRPGSQGDAPAGDERLWLAGWLLAFAIGNQYLHDLQVGFQYLQFAGWLFDVISNLCKFDESLNKVNKKQRLWLAGWQLCSICMIYL